MRVKLDKGAYLPTKAHKKDAGYDLRTPISFTIEPRGNVAIDTGVHIELPEGKCAVVMSKSGLYTKKKITSTGLIDEGFTGTILIGLINHSTEFIDFEAGEKISQFYITDYYDEPMEVVDELAESERGNDGYGSSGRF